MVRRAKGYVEPEDLDRQSARWLAEIRRSVAPRPRLVLHPEKCGLLVVDMLCYFASPEGRCYLPAAAAMTPRLAALIEAWHRRGGGVFFTRHCHEGPHDLGMLGRFFSDHIRCGEPDSEIIPELPRRPDDPVVRKTTYDAFLWTELEGLLRQRALEQVLVTGVLTHLCCETTARAAFCRGFEVYVAVDATASSEERLHFGSLLGLADGVAVILSTREILDRCGEPR
jgi:bifunctional isochorismate lyase/aryl carrier protein